jgi:hypothetical protein
VNANLLRLPRVVGQTKTSSRALSAPIDAGTMHRRSEIPGDQKGVQGAASQAGSEVKLGKANESSGVGGGYAITTRSIVDKLDHEGLDSHHSKRRKMGTPSSS